MYNSQENLLTEHEHLTDAGMQMLYGDDTTGLDFDQSGYLDVDADPTGGYNQVPSADEPAVNDQVAPSAENQDYGQQYEDPDAAQTLAQEVDNFESQNDF